jgi:glycosyltransferase involved in cell wall biosynthesis
MDLYARDISVAFDRCAPSFNYLLLQPGQGSTSWFRKQRVRYVGYPRLLNREIRTRKARLVHVLDHSYGHLCRMAARTVVTCHDVADLKASGMALWQRELWKWRVNGIKRASRVIAISRNTASDLQQLLRIPPERIVVNYYGVPDYFTPAQPASDSAPVRRLLALRSERFLFLHVGTNAVRKNIPLLLRAFSLLKRRHREVILVKVGTPFSESGYGRMLEELKIVEDVIDLGSVSNETLVDIYRSVDCMVFPSLYEGFGRPVLEAQACGIPCVVARSSCLEEVGGDAVLYHDPLASEDLANKMSEILMRQELRNELVKRGFANAARFTWEKHARTLLDVYAQVDPRPAFQSVPGSPQQSE